MTNIQAQQSFISRKKTDSFLRTQNSLGENLLDEELNALALEAQEREIVLLADQIAVGDIQTGDVENVLIWPLAKRVSDSQAQQR